MKVTIIIPSYNQKEYITEAIESALVQTYKCEVIVIDDGSTDGSLNLAKQYEPDVKVISQVNKGLASARNTGIMNATGDYILPLDADDKLLEDAVENLVKKAQETGADIIGPSVQCFGIGRNVVTLHPKPTLKEFRVGNHLAYCSLIKKSALLECGGYSPRMDIGYEDYHLWFDLLLRGKKIVTIPKPVFLYRTKVVSMWREAVKPENHAKLMGQIYRDFPKVWPEAMQREIEEQKKKDDDYWRNMDHE